MQKKKSLETWLYYFGLFLILPVVGVVILYYTGILVPLLHRLNPCIFHKLTGLYCPGCGGTRATLSLLQGHALISFLYHPIVIYLAVCYLAFMVSQTIARLTKGKGILGFCKNGLRYHDAYVYAGAAVLIGNFLIRNAVYLTTGLTFLE